MVRPEKAVTVARNGLACVCGQPGHRLRNSLGSGGVRRYRRHHGGVVVDRGFPWEAGPRAAVQRGALRGAVEGCLLFAVAFDKDVQWEVFRDLPSVRAALDAVPDPVNGLLVYRGRGGGAGASSRRRPRPHAGAGALALPEPEPDPAPLAAVAPGPLVVLPNA